MMTLERRLVNVHKVMHEDMKHCKDDHADLQKEQMRWMDTILDDAAVCRTMAAFFRGEPVLAQRPDGADEETVAQALDMGVKALSFPYVQIAGDHLTAKAMWMAETAGGQKPFWAQFIKVHGQWSVWKLKLDPVFSDLPEPYDAEPGVEPELEPEPMRGGPGEPPPGPGGPGEPPPGPGGPGAGPAPGGPPFDPDARDDIFQMDAHIARLTSDVEMITKLALPDFEREFNAANEKMDLCRAVMTPQKVLERMRTTL